MGHTHALPEAAAHGAAPHTALAKTPLLTRIVVVALVLATAAATVLGLVRLWPTGQIEKRSDLDYAVPGATFPQATVVSLTEIGRAHV